MNELKENIIIKEINDQERIKKRAGKTETKRILKMQQNYFSVH